MSRMTLPRPIVSPAPPPVPVRQSNARFTFVALTALSIYLLLAGTYLIARSSANWADSDTALLTHTIRNMADSQVLIPETGYVYDNGYAYSILSVTITAFTGIAIEDLVMFYYPLLSLLLILPAYIFYREVLAVPAQALLATMLLVIQPEFLFIALRGSHERWLRIVMFLLLWSFLRTFQLRRNLQSFAINVVLFYVLAYCMLAFNIFFAFSFAIGAILSLLVSVALTGRAARFKFRVSSSQLSRKLFFTSVILTVLMFLYGFYLYPPSLTMVSSLDGLTRRLILIFLSVTSSYNPYAAINQSWINIQTYIALSLFNYIMLAVTAIFWLWQGYRWLRRQDRSPNFNLSVLWVLYGAFAFQGGLAILADFSNFLGGNLQNRLFPSFAMLAAPVFAYGIFRFLRHRQHIFRYQVAFAVLFSIFGLMAVLKATNDPALSNKWTSATQPELLAMRWIDNHQSYSGIWIGFDERIRSAYWLRYGDSAKVNIWLYGDTVTSDARTFLISDVILAQAERLNKQLLIGVGENQVYDNGMTLVRRLRPATMYQN